MAAVAVTPYNAGRPAPGALTAQGQSAALAQADNWEIANDGRILVQIENKHVSQTLTVTIETPQVVDGLAVADRVYTVPPSTVTDFIGPFPPLNYGETLSITVGSDGTGHLTALRA